MAIAEALEGTVDRFWFHYDLRNDLLYVRLLAARDVESHGEESADGLIILRSMADDSVVGVTAVNWWKRFAPGAMPDSMSEFVGRIEPWVRGAGLAA
jgi:hypothetical protein